MNKNNAKDYLPFVQALADQKTVQMLSGCSWSDLEGDINFTFPPEFYRVKTTPMECWVLRYEGGSSLVFYSECNALEHAGCFPPPHTIHHMIEMKRP